MKLIPFITAASIAFCVPAHAAVVIQDTMMMCLPTEEFLARNRSGFSVFEGEFSIEESLDARVMLDPDTGRWSFVVHNAQNEVTCVLLAGDSYSLHVSDGTLDSVPLSVD